MTTYGVDLTSVNRPGGISDRRCSRGLLLGLTQQPVPLPPLVVGAYRRDDPQFDALVRVGARVAEARPGRRAVGNSVAFRGAFRQVTGSALYFHFPPIRAAHPTLVYVPDTIALRRPSSFPRRERAYYRLQGPMLRRTRSAVVTISAAERDGIIDAGYAPADRVHLIRLGLHVPCENRRSCGDTPTPPRLPTEYALVVGRLTERKNIDGVLTAWHRCRTLPPLVFAGPCENDRLRESIERHPSADYIGAPADEVLDQLYDRALLVVNASHDEGFGLPVGEALVRSKRIALSDIPAFREIASFVDDGCHFFDPSDPESILAAVEDALHHGATRPNDHERLRREFTWANSASDLLDALETTARDR